MLTGFSGVRVIVKNRDEVTVRVSLILCEKVVRVSKSGVSETVHWVPDVTTAFL